MTTPRPARSDRELAGLLATHPGVVAKLLALHVSDDHGRCRGCTRPGTGTPYQPWPCALRFWAAAAQQGPG